MKPLLKWNDLKIRKKPSLKGALAELAVAHECLKQGYFVSKSLDPSSPFDLVLTDDSGFSYLIDVKSVSRRKKDNSIIHRSLNSIQKQMKVKFYFSNINGERKPNENITRKRSRKIQKVK
jgi:hypothetical protein